MTYYVYCRHLVFLEPTLCVHDGKKRNKPWSKKNVNVPDKQWACQAKQLRAIRMQKGTKLSTKCWKKSFTMMLMREDLSYRWIAVLCDIF